MQEKIKGIRVLYIGPLVKGTITTQRIESLRELGAEVISFDTSPYIESLNNPISRRLAFKYSFGSVVIKLNKDIVSFARSIQYDIVWINKGIIINPNTVKMLKELSLLSKAVHYTADPAIFRHRTRYFTASIPIYSHCVTTKSYEVDIYKEKGAKKLIFVQQGYDKSFTNIVNNDFQKNEMYDVVFIGHGEKYYVDCIRAISKVTDNIAIWGSWHKVVRKYPDMAKYWKETSVYGADYVKMLRQGRICLGLLSQLVPDKTTTRTFEIPASKSFMLGKRSDEHLELFEEGNEAEFFDTLDELTEKVEFYLDNHDKRIKIANAGYQRCVTNNYSNTDRLKYVLERVLEDDHED